MIQSSYVHPYLIVIASQISDKLKFYMVIENQLLSVSASFEGILECVALSKYVYFYDFPAADGIRFHPCSWFLLKVHKLFNLQYNSKIKALMFFLECFVYKMPNARLQVQRYHPIGLKITDTASAWDLNIFPNQKAMYLKHIAIECDSFLFYKKIEKWNDISCFGFVFSIDISTYRIFYSLLFVTFT